MELYRFDLLKKAFWYKYASIVIYEWCVSVENESWNIGFYTMYLNSNTIVILVSL